MDAVTFSKRGHQHATPIFIDRLEEGGTARSISQIHVHSEAQHDEAWLQRLIFSFVSVLLVHHLKKGAKSDPLNELSGSMGLPGAADTIMTLGRARGQVDAELFLTGRDIDEDELALRFDKDRGTWTLLGSAEEHRRTQEQQEIIELLRSRAMTPAEITKELGIKPGTIRSRLYRMKEAGLVWSLGGSYALEGYRPD